MRITFAGTGDGRGVPAVGCIKVTPFDVSHKIPTFGIIFKYGDKRIVHFSDSGNTKLSDYQMFQVKQAQLVISIPWTGMAAPTPST